MEPNKDDEVQENWQELGKNKIDHWEPVISVDEKFNERRKGKVWIYYQDGRIFAKPPVFEGEEEHGTYFYRQGSASSLGDV